MTMHDQPVPKTHGFAADRVSLIAVAPVLRPSCMPHRPWALAVKLIAGHGTGGGRRGPRPGRRDQVPNLGTSSRTAGDAGSPPWIIQRTGPRQAARPR